jgi:hypothetical protein
MFADYDTHRLNSKRSWPKYKQRKKHKMTKQFQKVVGIFGIVLLVAVFFAKYPTSAQNRDDNSNLSANARLIEGVWDAQVTIRNCQTGIAGPTFRAMDLFVRGGAVVDTNSAPPSTRGPGFGSWEHLGGRSFTSTLRFFLYNPDGSFAGVRRIAQDIQLNEAADGWASTVNITVTAANGTVTNACATATATRFD